MSNPSLERWTELVSTVSLLSNQQAFRSSPLGQISLPVARCSVVKKNAFNSICRLTTRSLALEHTQRCREITTQDLFCRLIRLLGIASTNFNNQFHCCRKLIPSQAPESAATNSASPLLIAIFDCFLLDAVIGYQPSLPRNHDTVPFTLNRSASPAQSEPPYVNTDPTRTLFTASKLSVVGRTIIIPGFSRRYRKIDLMFLMSMSLARPRLREAFSIALRKSIHNHFPTSCQ